MAPKKNNQKMSLGDFLGDQSLGSWADEMEDMPVSSDARAGYGGGERRNFTAPPSGGMGDRSFSSRGFAVREELPMPSKPPFTAHLANLSFDATEGDVQDFFQDCEVVSVRIVEDRMEHKPKGFGYVEFKTVEGLKTAINKSGSDFLGRTIRLSVADPPKDRGEAREVTEWTRKGPLADLPQSQRRPSERGAGFERSFSRGYEAAPGPGMDAADRGSRRQTPFNEGPPPPARDLDWGARKGPLSPLPQQERPARDPARMRSNEGQTPTERRNSPAWGEGTNRSQDGSRPPRGDRPPVERVPTQAEKDNQWRSRMKPDAQKSPTPTPDPSVPSSPAQPPPPATRPKLNLQKRTVSEAEPSPVNATTPGDSKASPFGAARPIDTSAREKEVEEKRQLALRQKKEADEKARAERKVQQEKERAEKIAAARDAVPEENGEPAAEGDDEEKPKRSNFEILRRQTEENGENGDVEEEEDPEGVDASANGTIVDDKAVKPKEVTRDPPTGPRGTWRKGSNPNNDAAAANAGPTAENLEEDGWSTVPAKTRNTQSSRGRGRGRGGHGGQGTRAIAS